MFGFWHFLKRTLVCKSHPKQVDDAEASRHQNSNHRTKSDKLKRSNIIGFIRGSNRHLKIVPQCFTPKHEVGIDISDPITPEIVHDSPNSDIRVRRCFSCHRRNSGSEGSEDPHTRLIVQMESDGSSILICHKCGEKLKELDAVEAHHISEHSVTEIQEDSRQIIEKICGISSVNPENMLGQIDCILKVQGMPKTLACFEEYREMVKIKADKLQKKHPRCLADGNELLRFHGITVACPLGTNSSYSLCTLEYCGICQILRHGFSTNKESQGALGVYTTSTCGKAFDSIRPSEERPVPRKSVVVCRAIAGRIYSPLEEIQGNVDSGFDSLAEKKSGHSDADIEELYLLNPKALLPCFVVIFK
ncbi:uncharacterized protein LOC133312847 [Gastrolobium bilobum]|uniref:uncharacterized protein LOC133312847 n=1 Tax=Gastrolobium bilobum TaxID=150636 RepID=UPI002AB0196D|nr:uncharacterized protein LOC133312847 [Gastrolobium bilobum]